MHTVGKINREIYKCIAAEIMTDEVIIIHLKQVFEFQRVGFWTV